MPVMPVVKALHEKNKFSRLPQAYRVLYQSQEKSVAKRSVREQPSKIWEVNIGLPLAGVLAVHGALQSLLVAEESLAPKSTPHSRLHQLMYPIRRSEQPAYV